MAIATPFNDDGHCMDKTPITGLSIEADNHHLQPAQHSRPVSSVRGVGVPAVSWLFKDRKWRTIIITTTIGCQTRMHHVL